MVSAISTLLFSLSNLIINLLFPYLISFCLDMALKTTLWLLLPLLLSATYMQQCVDGQQVPCHFIFGDGLSDNGNNNPLPTTAKANYPPYGIDFPLGPTGRATNGRTMADYVGNFLFSFFIFYLSFIVFLY